MELNALIFDVDGVLADTEEAHRRAFNAAFAELGLGWAWDQKLYARLLAVAGGKARIRHYLKQIGQDRSAGPEGDERVERIHELKTKIYADLLAGGGVGLRPGVERLIREAHDRGMRLGIATTTGPANIVALFRNTIGGGALRWFDAIGAGGRVQNLKPSPDIYRWVLDILGLDPAACLAIEDSSNGLKACRGAGIGAVITTTGYTHDEDFSGAVAVLSDLGEPDSPFEIRQGDAFDKNYVDVDLLRRWHKKFESSGRPP
ncbi:MAG: hypothetical protein A3G18_02810 [Rhodospirillales bacterium RIFCSPLOWO2_12_FULL_58_28]|nr:MAG: hypothetical protein A3H92_00775 [Rhodospirillales bacterium RIFCSPLOWO2_02_FULL_58_16]OHC77079.1 MAG: hypothetical protein A3G18_02810 [Rhodospirillales bacterium RIFCSPLOWO2_12_FULL_58_28]